MLALRKNIRKPLLLYGAPIPTRVLSSGYISSFPSLPLRHYSSSIVLFRRITREVSISKRSRSEVSIKSAASNIISNNKQNKTQENKSQETTTTATSIANSPKGKFIYVDEDFCQMERISYHLRENRSIKKRIKFLNQFLQYITAQQATPVEFRSPVQFEELYMTVLPALEVLLRDMSSLYHTFLNLNRASSVLSINTNIQPSEIADNSKTPTFNLLLNQVARLSQHLSQITKNIILLNHINCAAATVKLHHMFLSHIATLIQHHQMLPVHPQYQEEQIVLTDALCDSLKALQTISNSYSHLPPTQFSLISLFHNVVDINNNNSIKNTTINASIHTNTIDNNINLDDSSNNIKVSYSDETVAKTIHSLFAPLVSRIQSNNNPPDLLWVIQKTASRLEIMRQLLPPVSSVSQMLLCQPLVFPFLPQVLQYIASQSILTNRDMSNNNNINGINNINYNAAGVAAEAIVDSWDTLTNSLSHIYPEILLRHANNDSGVSDHTHEKIVQETLRLLSLEAVSQASRVCVMLPQNRSGAEEVVAAVSRVWCSVATLGLRFGVSRHTKDTSLTNNQSWAINMVNDNNRSKTFDNEDNNIINSNTINLAEQNTFHLIQDCLATLVPLIRSPVIFPSLSVNLRKKDLETIGQKYYENEMFYLQQLLQPLISLQIKASDFDYNLQKTLLKDVCDSLQRLSINNINNDDDNYMKYDYYVHYNGYGKHRDAPVSYGQLLRCEEKWELFCATLETTHALQILPDVTRHSSETLLLDTFLENVSQALHSVSQSLSLVATTNDKNHNGNNKKENNLLRSLRFLDQIDYDDNDIYAENNYEYYNEKSDNKKKKQDKKSLNNNNNNNNLNEEDNNNADIMHFFTHRLLQSLCLFNYNYNNRYKNYKKYYYNYYNEPLMQWKLLMPRKTQRLLSKRIVAEHHPSVTNFAELANVFELLSELKVPFYDSETAMTLISPLMEEVKRLGRTDTSSATLHTLTQLYLGFGKLGVQWKNMEPELKRLLGHVLTQEGKQLSLQHLSDDNFFDGNKEVKYSEQHLLDAHPLVSYSFHRHRPPLLVEVLAFSLMTKWKDLTRLEQSLVLQSLAVQLRQYDNDNIDNNYDTDDNNTYYENDYINSDSDGTPCLEAMKALSVIQCPWYLLAHTTVVKEVVDKEEEVDVEHDTERHNSAQVCMRTLVHLLLRHLTLRDIPVIHRDSPHFTPDTQQHLLEQRSEHVARLLVRMQAKWHDIDTTLQHYLASPWIYNNNNNAKNNNITNNDDNNTNNIDIEKYRWLCRLSSVANSLTFLAFDASPLPRYNYSISMRDNLDVSARSFKIIQTQYDIDFDYNGNDDINTVNSNNNQNNSCSNNYNNNITNTMNESFDDPVFFTELEDELLHDWCRHILDDLLLLLCPATLQHYTTTYEQSGLWLYFTQTQKTQMFQLLSLIKENTKRFPLRKNNNNGVSDINNNNNIEINDDNNGDVSGITPNTTSSTSSKTHLRFQEALQKELLLISRRTKRHVTLVSEYPGFVSQHNSTMEQDIGGDTGSLSVDTDIFPMDLAVLDSRSSQPVAFIEIDGPHHYRYFDNSNTRNKLNTNTKNNSDVLRKIDQLKERLYRRKYPNVPIYRVSHRDLNFVMLNAVQNSDSQDVREYGNFTRTKDFNKKDNFSENVRSDNVFLNEQKSKTSTAAKNIVEQMQKDGIL